MTSRIFLGRYEAIRLLGEGGMGRVYLARQLDLGRQVVVKVMHDHIAADPKFCERFQRETLLMARFQHPYAVTLYDASLNDPQGPCIIMEYIRGVGLDTMVRRNGRMTAARVARLLGQLCEVLQAAHLEGIIHRDLKPSNLMVVDPDTPYEKVKVLDFGLAKLADTSNSMKITEDNTEFAIGTPGYMCPEQARGEEMDNRGDLYSVGVMLYEMLTGRLPFFGRATMDVMLAHATEPPPSFHEAGLGDVIPSAVETVVLDCLSKHPNDRPQSARDLAERFETALAHEQAMQETLVPPGYPDRPPAMAAMPAPTCIVRPSVQNTDPHAVVHHVEAFMPEAIATYKLRGFVAEVGGEVIESVPGLIRVRLGGKGMYASNRNGWFGLGRKSGLIDMELRLERADAERDALLNITLVLRPVGNAAATSDFRERCNQVFCDLRAYVMGR
jgi:eukaryotic-like serine/threonine-protein kinase